MIIKMIARPRSRASRIISKEASMGVYLGRKKHPNVDVLINYGLAGTRLAAYYKRYPLAERIPTINKYVGKSKYAVIKEMENAGILVPESVAYLKNKSKPKEWIEKKINSIGGIGIIEIKAGKTGYPRNGKYFQRFIKNRIYEIRVHAFKWMSDWTVQKRYGDDNEIAWNYKNGGVFSTVRRPENYEIFKKAIEVSKQVLKIRHMAFGAVDFIVDDEYNLYFIEINSAPGFQELSENIYIDAFLSLKDMKKKDILKFANR